MVSRGSPENGVLAVLRIAALIVLITGAAGSFALMLRAGHRNNSRVLLLLFTIWVLSPFVALVWANSVSKRWPVPARATLYSVTLAITLGAMAIYGVVALGPPRAKPAFAFLMIPLGSWLLMAIAASITRRRARG